MRTYNLLIADDESLISESLSTMDEWEERNIIVVGTASNGLEVLDWFNHTHIDILITDIRMPDMNGLELMKEVHDQNPDTSIIVISGYEEFSYVKTALMYKAEGYVLKPIDTDELLDIIDKIIAKRAAQQPAEEIIDDAPKTYHESIVTRAISYMHDHLDNEITLKEAADLFHLTTHYFGQVFKTVTGQTFLSYLTKLRMDKACELLKNPELTQYEVGEKVGYRDARYFSKIFQRTFNMTPRDFRKQLNKKKFL